MMVKFATLCDQCRARSDEYSAWPTCDGCDQDTCPACTAEELTDWDVDHHATVLCVDCHEAVSGSRREAVCPLCKKTFDADYYAAFHKYTCDELDK